MVGIIFGCRCGVVLWISGRDWEQGQVTPGIAAGARNWFTPYLWAEAGSLQEGPRRSRFRRGPSHDLVDIRFPLRSYLAQSPPGSRAFRLLLISLQPWPLCP